MNLSSDITHITIDYVRQILMNDSSGHDYGHCLRVAALAEKIAQNYNCNTELIQLASLLHDVDDKKIFGDNDNANIRSFFAKNFIPEEMQIQIQDIINFISLDKQDDTVSIETKIVQDADNLDALGAIGLARMFAFGGAKGVVVYSPEECENDSFSHYHNRLIRLPECMNTKEGLTEANLRIQFMEHFINQFLKEVHGG